MPENQPFWIIRIDGINRVVFGGYVNNIVRALRGDSHSGQIKRLRIDVPIDGNCKQFSKIIRVYVVRSEDRFVNIGPDSGFVVVVGEDSSKTARPGRIQRTRRQGITGGSSGIRIRGAWA